ncbi:hypothetical protein EV426DRAFT_708543 [Tirmania nivea]|nr:hypothetical protein EV426DRAFT_708543 [Tirmania nivea]
MRFYAQPCIAAFGCLITYFVPVNSAPVPGRLAVPGLGSPTIIPEPRRLVPGNSPHTSASSAKSQADPKKITIDLAKDLYNSYDEHASGIDACPNTAYHNTIPPTPPQNQNERVSGTSHGHSSGPGSGASGANAVDITRPGERDVNVLRPNNAVSNRPSRANPPALGNMQINSGQFPDRQQASLATGPSPATTPR